jgi:hypothetical protein
MRSAFAAALVFRGWQAGQASVTPMRPLFFTRSRSLQVEQLACSGRTRCGAAVVERFAFAATLRDYKSVDVASRTVRLSANQWCEKDSACMRRELGGLVSRAIVPRSPRTLQGYLRMARNKR